MSKHHRKRSGEKGLSLAKIKINPEAACLHCYRPQPHCFCGQVQPVNNQLSVLILEHPQEKWKILNSSPLAQAILHDCQIKVGFNWPNVAVASDKNWSPAEWAVLFLKGKALQAPLTLRNRKGEVMTDPSSLKGLIALNATWQQAKGIWWRNPWFLKLNTIELNPGHASLRAQVRKDGLSTIEALGFALSLLEGNPTFKESLYQQYQHFIIEPAAALLKSAQSSLFLAPDPLKSIDTTTGI